MENHSPGKQSEITMKTLEEARRRIEPWIHRTPVLRNSSIDRLTGASLVFKCENFQKVGAFKFRGATNAVMSLTDQEASLGVATHSSGNHAQALALAAKNRGIPSYVVMPSNSSPPKRNAVFEYGASIVDCEPNQRAREVTLSEVVAKTGAAFVHPYDDHRVIAGQATAALELIEETRDLDIIMTPVGGGGLLSGTALATYFVSPRTSVIGAEPKGADDARRSMEEGRIIPSLNPKTIADGLLTSLGESTFPIISKYVDEILNVEEDSIVRAMRMVWERMKILIEPSSAVPVAAVLENKKVFAQKRIGVIISGGNVDLDNLPWR